MKVHLSMAVAAVLLSVSVNTKKVFTNFVSRVVLFASALFFSVSASAQVQWTVMGGEVTGAKNVAITLGGNTSYYDVVFGDTLAPIPTFMSSSFSAWASEALLSQVFVASAPLNLDQDPGVMSGCKGACAVMTVYGDNGYLGFSMAINHVEGGGIVRDEHDGNHSFNPYLAAMDSATYASWSVSAVPELESYALMLTGLGFIGVIVSRRKANQV